MSNKNPLGLFAIFTTLLVCSSFVAEALEAPKMDSSVENYSAYSHLVDVKFTEAAVLETDTPPTTSVVEITGTTTTSTVVATPYEGEGGAEPQLPTGKCDEWYITALDAGWEMGQLTKLGQIMWAESRCLHDVSNCCSYGLAQMEWSAHKHWLKSDFGITDKYELYDPLLNLQTAKWLFDYAEEHYGCGWQPWYMSGDWC